MIASGLVRRFRGIVRSGTRFGVVSHREPDGDAAGSMAALVRWLRRAGKTAVPVNATPGDAALSDFFRPAEVRADFGSRRYDAVFVLDCGDFERTGLVDAVRALSAPVVNIDHHTTNTRFGDLDLVDPGARATCEVLFDLFGKSALNRSVAEPLLHGMMTDTRIFQVYGLKSPYFRKTADLLETGLSYDRMFSRITESNSLGSLKALIERMRYLKNSTSGKVVWTLIGRGSRGGRHFDLLHFQLAELLFSIREARFVFVAYDQGPRGVHVELRSRKPYAAVKPALLLGGGGHTFASGCQIMGSLASAERRVLAAVRRVYPDLFVKGN